MAVTRHLQSPMVPPVDATITGATDQSEYVTEAWRWFWMRGRRPVVSRSMRRWDRGLALGATGTLLRWNYAYRVVQLDFTPEIEVLYMLFERCYTKM